MNTLVYFRKPVTDELRHYEITADQTYSVDQYEDYRKLAEQTFGIPLQFVLIRVK
jgi:hypothetical protein